jgi:hypothetical protein
VGANGRKFLQEMYTREIYERVFYFDHWASNLPPREPEVFLHPGNPGHRQLFPLLCPVCPV